MLLSESETSILNGDQGPTLQKIMKTLVCYGKSVGAERLVDIESDGHFSISSPLPGVGAPLPMLAELVDAELSTKFPFTLDPRDPLDFKGLGVTQAQADEFKRTYKDEGVYQQYMKKLGLKGKSSDAYTCAPYVFENGNAPEAGSIIAWSESSCVVYANSVLGARTNRNAAIMDLLSNIVGKTPLFDLLTDEGRLAHWHIDVNVSELPHPQVLGAEIGNTVQNDVPYITGLDRFFPNGLDERARDYLKEMGAACAAIGAVGLYHVEGLTPEAMSQGKALLRPGHQRHSIDNTLLNNLIASYPVMWNDPDADPQKVLIGCPHLSLRELHEWKDRIAAALTLQSRETVAVDTVMVAPPTVLREFRNDHAEACEQLRAMGVRLSSTCLEAYMTNKECAAEAVLTNSNKLRTFTNARLVVDAQLATIIASGSMPEQLPDKTVSVSADSSVTADSPVKFVGNIESVSTAGTTRESEYRGRVLHAGEVEASALVSRRGFNSLASFYDAVLSDEAMAYCGDHDTDIYKQPMTGTALCLPKTIGSTSAGSVWEVVARRNLAPAAMLFSEKIDSLAAAGLAIADAWLGLPIIAIDSLGDEFLTRVNNGDKVRVTANGQVFVSSPSLASDLKETTGEVH